MIKDINPTGSSDLGQFTEYNGKLYFRATDSLHGHELWASDGTASGTKMVKNILPDPSGGLWHIIGLNVLGNQLIFSGYNGSNNNFNVLWATNGTAQATKIFKRVHSGNDERFVFKSRLYFEGRDTSSIVSGLWATNGTDSGTVLIKDSLSIKGFAEYHGKLYFLNTIGPYSYEVWETDGTTNGTKKVTLPVGTSNNNPLEYITPKFTKFKGGLYFEANYFGQGKGLWRIISPVPASAENFVRNLELKISPNPALNTITINTARPISMVYIKDLSGRTIKEVIGKNNMDISELVKGIYIIEVFTKESHGIKKFIKK